MTARFIDKFIMCALAALVGLCLGIPAPMFGQIVGATITGTVTDPSGAVTPGVKMIVTNVATGVTRNAVTNGVGFYTAPNLIPGNYQITASATGFKTQVRKGIVLTVGQELVLNLAMQVGGVTQQVTVTGAAPTVDLANATMGGVNNRITVVTLPLNGRSWTDLATLAPGIHMTQDQPPITAGDRVKRGLANDLVVAGGRPQQNIFLLDGIDVDDYANAGPASSLGGNLGVDAVQEFSVLTANVGPQYNTAGGVISAITKSGTNQFHGDAYEFLRNDAFDAANFIDNESNAVKAPLRRNQFGASAGGPIRKDKTFIFGDYEGVRQSFGQTTISNVPSAAMLAGNLSSGPVTPDPSVVRFLTAFYPAPNGPILGDTGIFSFTGIQKTAENFFITRLDQTFSEQDHLSGTFMIDRTTQAEPDEMDNKLLRNPSNRYMVGLEWSHIVSPTLMNSVRIGYNRDVVASPSGATPINPASADLSFGFVPGDSAGMLSAGGLQSFSGGISAAAPFEFHWWTTQLDDNVFYTRGSHSIKFGASFDRIGDNTIGEDQPGGLFQFNTLSDLLTNNAGSFLTDTPGTESPRGIRQSMAGAYVSDDWRFRPNLTFNYGLRYQMATIITEVQGKLGNLRNLTSATVPNHLGSPYIQNPTHWDFEPRIGFAWDPFHNGKTAIRGGFGVFDMMPLPVQMGSGVDGTWPFDATNSLSPAAGSNTLATGLFPTGAFFQALSQATHRFYILQFNPKRNYIFQYNFNIQRQIAPATTLMVGYVGARGYHFWDQADDNNMVLPTQTPQGLEWPCPSFSPFTTPQGTTIQLCNQPGTGTIINPALGRLQMALWDGQYYYDGLNVQVEKTMSHGIQLQGSYTFSKNIDYGSGSVASDPYRNSISSLLYFCMKCKKSLSDTNIAHDLTVNGVWDIPSPSFFTGPEKSILGGWEAGGILTMETGSPFTVRQVGDPVGQNSTDPFSYPDRLVAPGCANPVNPQNANDYIKLQCFAPPNPSTRFGNAGRNTLTGPGLIEFDFSLMKNFPFQAISENFNAQFRAEFFNLANRPNFTSPNDNTAIMDNTGAIQANAGAITLTNTTARQIQFSLKLSW
ncbi:MAG: TonB-dependent receptor domain-containing protein [Terriglobia bacterium]